jgi:hypothetical protein
MKKATKPSVGKLLRVLVAGGVALAATPGPPAAMAEEAPEKAGKATEKDRTTPKPDDAPAAKKKAPGTEKDKEKEKKEAEEAGGVKGW